jgi:hypothetical protein
MQSNPKKIATMNRKEMYRLAAVFLRRGSHGATVREAILKPTD